MSTVKFNRLATVRTLLTVPDSDALTFPNGDWTVGAIIVFNGDTTGDNSKVQYVFRTGEYQSSGHLGMYWNPASATNNYNFQSYITTMGAAKCRTAIKVEPGKAYYVGLSRINNNVYSKICPVLQTAPTDGSAVLSGSFTNEGAQSLQVELNSAGSLLIGGRNATDRQFDQSMGRLFRVDRALSDFEIAQLAHGHEITEFATPAWYFRLSNPNDLVDVGPLALPTTISGIFTQGAEPGFGYISNPTAPTMTGKPNINGAAQIGTAVSYTPALAVGSPTPPTTQQWTLDGVDVPGAVDATYTPVSSDAGKILRVRQIATNQSGTISAVSDGVLVVTLASGLEMTPFVAETIYQQINGSAKITFNGTWVGSVIPTKLEYRLYAAHSNEIIKTWTDMSAVVGSSGSWTASPSIPAPTNGKKYRIALRSLDANGNILFTTAMLSNRFGVGNIIGFIGSSSPASWVTNGTGTGYVPDHDAVSTITGSGSTSNWGLFGTSGVAIQMANYIAEQLGMPVCIFGSAVSGDTLTNWTNTSSGSWTNFVSRVAYAGGKLAGVFGSMGSNDSTNASQVISRAGHFGKIKTVIDNTRLFTNQPNLPFLWSGFNRRTTGALVPQSNYIRMAECDIGDYPNVYHVQSLDFTLGGDGIHLVGSESARLCTRSQYVWVNAMKGKYLRGPKIVGMRASGSEVLITLEHRGGTDFTPNAGGTGFTASNDSGVVNILSATKVSSTQIKLVCDGAPTQVQYLAGAAPEVGTPFYSNGDPVLPMTVETDLPLFIGDLPEAVITNQPVPNGQAQRFGGTTTLATSGTYTLIGKNGTSTIGPLPFDIIEDSFVFEHVELTPGTYTPVLTVIGPGGIAQVAGTKEFTILGVTGGGELLPMLIATGTGPVHKK